MKKIVIAGSAKLPVQINNWRKFFNHRGYEILDYPQAIQEEHFMELYPKIHQDFLKHIIETDILFIMNEDKSGKVGYIGAETFAELMFGLAQKLVFHKNIELIILKMPSADVQCYEEVVLWLRLGWLKLVQDTGEI